MKKRINYIGLFLLMFAFLATSTVNGQEWSKDQKAVWKEVENGWAAWKSKDTEAAFAGIHEKYLGWNQEDPLPISKAKWKSMQEQWKDNMTIEYYDLQPARIVIEGDNAVVYYFFEFYSVFEKGDMKKENSVEGRNVEFYIKEKGKWMLLGDMTYFDENDD